MAAGRSGYLGLTTLAEAGWLPCSGRVVGEAGVPPWGEPRYCWLMLVRSTTPHHWCVKRTRFF